MLTIEVLGVVGTDDYLRLHSLAERGFLDVQDREPEASLFVDVVRPDLSTTQDLSLVRARGQLGVEYVYRRESSQIAFDFPAISHFHTPYMVLR